MTPKELYLYPITGLYYECHNVDYSALVSASRVDIDGKHCLRVLNDIWWNRALSRKTLELIVERLSNRYQFSTPQGIQHRAILANPEKFMVSAQEAPRTLANLGAGARKAFRALETLQIFCQLYSEMIAYPFTLSLQEGLLVNELSSLLLSQEALNPTTNPYLGFIEEHYLPVLYEVKPDIVWISGPIKISTFAMAMLAKRTFPNCHVSVTNHSSEYYSLNKITKYLKLNSTLFETVDSVVLDDFENTIPQLVECIGARQSLNCVPNLMYIDRASGSIETTPMQTSTKSLDYDTHYHGISISPEERYQGQIDPSQLVDLRLWPNAKCYWDQCNFCAINRKYQTLPKNSFRDVEEKADYMIRLSKLGITHFWSGDEAIPPKTLGELAEALIARGANFVWETRSKIDKNFTQDICEALGRSGLREIRLGLESASPRVLSAMGKFPLGWSLELIEQVVSYFHDAGVSVHFPTIVGFPTETDAERAETFSFLQYIVNKFPSVTFNMNVLGFDVASKLFEEYEAYGITTVRWPAPAKYFLGNLLDWDCEEVPFDYDRLDVQRNELMRKLLYPWMPTTATIPTYIYYRLTETSRATMVWKSTRYQTNNWKDNAIDLQYDQPIILSPGIVITGPLDRGQYAQDKRYFVYDWETHHTLECDEQGLNLLQTIQSPMVYDDVMKHMHDLYNELPPQEITGRFDQEIKRLFRMGIIRSAEDLNPLPMSEVSGVASIETQERTKVNLSKEAREPAIIALTQIS